MSDGVLELTRQSDLQPLIANGIPVFRMYGQIRIELLRGLSQDHLGLFADPNPDPTSGDIQWFAPNPGQIGRLADCTEDQRQEYEFHLARLVDDITQHIERLNRTGDDDARNMANVLTMALEIPDESHIFVVGGLPVLAGWGHVPRGPAVLRKPLIALAKRVLTITPPPAPEPDVGPGVPPSPQPEPAAHLAQAPPLPPEQPEPHPDAGDPADGTRIRALIPIVNEVVGPARIAVVNWALWPILAVLLVAIGYLLLRYCALGWPLSLLADNNPILNYCVGGEPLRNNDLSAHLADLQAALAEKQRRLCAATPIPAPTPPPVLPPNNSRRRVEDAGGRIGAVNVILTWSTDDDLDLHVTCPSGKVIYHGNKQDCGGVLDVDANSSDVNKTTSPAENITWPEGAAPAGTYKVEVDPYRRRNAGRPIDFKVDLLINSEVVDSRTGRFEVPGKISVFEFTLPYTRGRQ
jgi:hypothetical protein